MRQVFRFVCAALMCGFFGSAAGAIANGDADIAVLLLLIANIALVAWVGFWISEIQRRMP